MATGKDSSNLDNFCVFVCCHKGDFFLTKSLCQSIRFFCGRELPIFLIKDGTFDTSQLKRLGNIWEFDSRKVPEKLRTRVEKGGWGLRKLYAFFQEEYTRFLYLDSDILLVSNILELPYREYDFYVDTSGFAPVIDKTGGDVDQFHLSIERFVFDLAAIKRFDPGFVTEHFIPFNSGQIFGCTGLLSLPMTLECIELWNRQAGVFRCADQGILNYLLNKGAQDGLFTLGGERFRIGGYEKPKRYPGLTRESLINDEFDERYLIHWAGINEYRTKRFPFSFALEEFQDQYYSQYPYLTRHIDWIKLQFYFWFRQLRSWGGIWRQKFRDRM